MITDDPAVADEKLTGLAPFCVAERGSLKHAGFDLSSLPAREYGFTRLVVSDSDKLDGLVEAATRIPRELVGRMHAVGKVDEVTAFYRRHIDAGVRHFIINPCLSPDPEATLEAFARQVLPRLGAG